AEAALQEARRSARRDPSLHLSRILEAAALLQTGRDHEARVALVTARGIRPALTLHEVARANGRRVAARLGCCGIEAGTRGSASSATNLRSPMVCGCVREPKTGGAALMSAPRQQSASPKDGIGSSRAGRGTHLRGRKPSSSPAVPKLTF